MRPKFAHIAALAALLVLLPVAGFTDILFYEDFEDELSSSDWQFQNQGTGNVFSVSSEQHYAGSHSGKYYLSGVGNPPRLEHALVSTDITGSSYSFEYNKTYWMGYAIYLPSTNVYSNHPIIGQFHGIPDAPVGTIPGVSCDTYRNGIISMPKDSGSGGTILTMRIMGQRDSCGNGPDGKPDYDRRSFPTEEGSYLEDAWNTVVMKVRFNFTTGGELKVWLNGDLLFDDDGIVGYNDVKGPYFKIGLYSGSSSGVTAYYDEFKIGDENATYDDVLPGGGAEPPGESPIYTGWYNNSGTPTTNPADKVYLDGDRTYLRKWTATTNGTAYSVRVYVPDVAWDAEDDESYVVAYKMVDTTLTILGYATFNPTEISAWPNEVLLSAPDGYSLSFSSGDDIYYGIAADPVTSPSGYIAIGRNNTGGDGLYYSTKTLTGATPHLTLAAGDMSTPSLTRDMAFVLGYTIAEDTDDPTVTITSPTSDATYNSPAGVRTISLSGTCSDASSHVVSVTWADNHGNSGSGSISDPWTSWFINDLVLAAGSTEFTVTATDSYDNTNTDTITVTFVGPTGTLVGWDNNDNPPNDAISATTLRTADRIYERSPWTAPAGGGELKGMYWYVGDTWSPTNAWIVAHKVDGDNYKLLSYEPIQSVALSSYNYLSFQEAVSGQSLQFAENDQILYGIAFDAGDGIKFGQEGTGGDGLMYYIADLSGGPTDMVIASTAITETDDPGFTLVYTSLPGDTTNPSVEITTPSAAISIPVSTYTIAGTASDETELDSVRWYSDEFEEYGELTVTDGNWSSLIPIGFGVNTITVEAFDATGNSSTDTVVITQVNPTSTLSGSGTFQ